MSLLATLEFLRPLALWLFLPWCWLVAARAILPPHRAISADPRATPWARWVDAKLLPYLLTDAVGASRPPVRRWPLALVGALLILALAGPRVLRSGEAANPPPMRPDIARVLVADLSPGFAALSDAERARVRLDLRRFLRALPPGETALVVAAGGAWPVVPLTEDLSALDAFIGELSADAVPVAGDRPALALALARRLLADSGARERRIYWLRAGEMPSALRVPAPSGDSLEFLQATEDADRWLAAVDAARAGDRRGAWRDSALNLSPPPDQRWIDLGPYLALLALPLAAIGWRLTVTLLLFAALVAPGDPAWAAGGDFERGVALYRAGDFAASAAAFARVDPRDARGHYNRGNALAKAGRLRAALAAYDEALRLRPDDAATRHNRAIVESLLQSPPPTAPPPPPPPGAPPPPSPASVEAQRAAEQWLRKPPGDSDGLLRRKLALEEARRKGEVVR